MNGEEIIFLGVILYRKSYQWELSDLSRKYLDLQLEGQEYQQSRGRE